MPVQSDDKVGQALSALNLLETLRLLSATFYFGTSPNFVFFAVDCHGISRYYQSLPWEWHGPILTYTAHFSLEHPIKFCASSPPHCLIILVHLSLGSADALDKSPSPIQGQWPGAKADGSL